MTRSKYKNEWTEYGGVRYHSKKEARYAWGLDMALKSGDLLSWKRQVPFVLPAGIRYLLDFEEHWKDGSVRYVDVKGFKTYAYKLKKKMVEALHHIQIMET